VDAVVFGYLRDGNAFFFDLLDDFCFHLGRGTVGFTQSGAKSWDGYPITSVRTRA
jgi:hypothetical protein